MAGWVFHVALFALAIARASAQSNEQAALTTTLRGTSASATWIRMADATPLAHFGRPIQATPGSTLKPFVLLAALEAGVAHPNTTVECRGTLSLVDHGRRWNLACTHPRSTTVFNARDALVYSCNTWFAHAASTLSSDQLVRSLDRFGLHAQITRSDLQSPEARILLTLGLSGIEVSVSDLAHAYRQLALLWMNGNNSEKVAALVRDGLLQSVHYGMADNAYTAGRTVAGKTGTATNSGNLGTHGWFAAVLGDSLANSSVLVIYVPHGSGAEAAKLAHRVLSQTTVHPTAITATRSR